MTVLTGFRIGGLHNRFDVACAIRDGRLILVGPNGTGKSTIINIVYYALTGQWARLSEYQFSSVQLNFKKSKVILKRSDINAYLDESLSLPPTLRRQYDYLLSVPAVSSLLKSRDGKLSKSDLSVIRDIVKVRDFDVEYFFSRLSRFSSPRQASLLFNDPYEKVRGQFTLRTIFLPTYRRIEKDLKSIYPDIEERFRSRPDTDSGFTRRAAHFLELVNFGMKDVTSLLTQTSQNLRDFSRSQVSALTVSYLRDVILNKIGEGGEFYSANVDSNLLISAVSLLDNASLLNEERAALANRLGNLSSGSSSEEKHFLHFVSMLADFARKVRGNEAKAQNFVTLVNKYLYGKSVSLSDSSYDFTVSDSDGGKIDLQDLSSGEKQVISLFSHIMLENADPFAIIIDEPELSLSVRWQEEFLPDVYSQESCKFLLAVTHSPSIIDNDMREYAIDVRKLFKRVA